MSPVADVVERLRPKCVLVAGSGTGEAGAELRARGLDVVGVDEHVATMQLDRRFDLILLSGSAVASANEASRRAVVHNIAQHLLPSGAVVSCFEGDASATDLVAAYDAVCADCELTLESRWSADQLVSVHRRGSRYNVHDMVFEARSSIRRLTPDELMHRLGDANPPLVVDTRSLTDRAAVGAIAGAIHLPRSVVEWRLDPANGYRHPFSPPFDRPIVVVCNDGYSSSLSAANLVRIGFTDVADMIGGMAAWSRAGLPIEACDGG